MNNVYSLYTQVFIPKVNDHIICRLQIYEISLISEHVNMCFEVTYD